MAFYEKLTHNFELERLKVQFLSILYNETIYQCGLHKYNMQKAGFLLGLLTLIGLAQPILGDGDFECTPLAAVRKFMRSQATTLTFANPKNVGTMLDAKHLQFLD